MTRIRELDAVRGLAALMVVFHHDLFLSGALSPALIGHIRSTPLQGLVSGRPFVLMFFVLSGFVLSRSLGQRIISLDVYLTWMAQRSIRLMVPALGSVAVSAALYSMVSDTAWQHEATAWMLKISWTGAPTGADILQQGLLVSDPRLNVVLWSLAVEWRLSFLIPLMVWLASPRFRQGGVILLIACVGLTSLAGGTWASRIMVGGDFWESLQSLLYFLSPFAIGVLLDRSGVCNIYAERLTIYAALFACIGLARVPHDFGAFLCAALVIWTVQQPSFARTAMRTPPLLWLGKISFSLYLVHTPVLASVFHTFHSTMSDQQMAGLAIAASLPVAWLFYIAIEHPAHLLARAIKPSRATAIPSSIGQTA